MGWTALIYAASAGHFEVCRLLVDKGAGVNVMSTKGFSATRAANNRGHTAIRDFLISRGGV
jgi:ankyrin repeat protein